MARHDDAAKEWGALGARALVPSAITYEPKINSRTVQGERTGQERGRKGEKSSTARKPWEKPKGEEEGGLTGRLY